VSAGTIPLMPSVGDTVKSEPLHTVVEISLISAVGCIVTVKVNEGPKPQLGIDGVMVYVTVLVTLEVLKSVPEIKSLNVPDSPPMMN
jgi:hypothetical protein